MGTLKSLTRSGLTFLIIFFTSISLHAENHFGAFEEDTIYVATGATSGAMDGSSWSDAFIKLQNALSVATAGDTIVVASGLYFPDEGAGITNDDSLATFNIPDSVVLLGGFPIMGSGTRDPLANPTILSGSIGDLADFSDNTFNIVTMTNVSVATCIDGFTITFGNARMGTGSSQNGGGIYNRATAGDTSAPTIINCAFAGNYAETRGGAIYNGADGASSACLPKILDCTFINNSCGFDGGGIFNSGLNGGICRTIIDSCLFKDNSANAAGAVHVFASANGEASALIYNSNFQDNIATSNGGAVHNVVFDGNSYTEVHNSTFTGNTAGWSGGGFYSYAATTGFENSPIIDSCTFEYNVAQTIDGGAIDLWAEQGKIAAQIDNSYFKNNHATGSSGGGIMNYAAGATARNESIITNCTFEGNTAAYGGAVNNFAYMGTDSTQIIQCLFFNDSAMFSGAIDIFADIGKSTSYILNNTITENYSMGNAAVGIEGLSGVASGEILNSIISGNNDAAGTRSIAAYTASATIDYSIVDTTNCLGLGDGISCGPNMFFNLDPQLKSDFTLSGGSPAINTGLNDSLNSLGITTDLSGSSRFINTTVDMGVFEYNTVCEDTLKIYELIKADLTYHAALAVLSNATLGDTSDIIYKAGNCISLLEGFDVPLGGLFEANIEDCITYLISNPEIKKKRHDSMFNSYEVVSKERIDKGRQDNIQRRNRISELQKRDYAKTWYRKYLIQ